MSLADGSTQTLTTRSIVVATGAEPFVPPLPGLADIGYLTSDTLWGLRELPKRLVVLGAKAVNQRIHSRISESSSPSSC